MKNSTSTHEDGVNTRKNTISKIGGAAAISLALLTAPVQEAIAEAQIRTGACVGIEPVRIQNGNFQVNENMTTECITTTDNKQYMLQTAIGRNRTRYSYIVGKGYYQRIFYPAVSFGEQRTDLPKIPLSFVTTTEAPKFSSEVADILNARHIEATKAKINQGDSKICESLRYFHRLPADILITNLAKVVPGGFIYNGIEILEEEKKHYPDLIKQCEAKGL